ncbi:hypothetical protein [Streptomyces sp. NPDC018352]|uniref:hypothetical protein n=1 Tax=Streptomyces sp. NPDC018352 TaxID=3157194 RepID=UPI003400A67A
MLADAAVAWASGLSEEKRLPSIVLVRDEIVPVAGDTAFSVRPDRPRPVAG